MFNMIPYRRANRSPSLFDDRFFRSFFDMSEGFRSGFQVDVRDDGDKYVMEAELPGLKQEDIELTVDNDVLTISAQRKNERREEKENYLYCERRSGRFQRSFTLDGVNQDQINAKYQDGVLTLLMPKTAPEQARTQRKIPIQGIDNNAQTDVPVQ
ncbi:MAG: Hsp20/alpha crystallin family protein [Oscillospiraceae bacterium]|jgi:HSP20 family protein|nr:Hsp20/alpha crystallin family protein [Oscillospiraceae bacterium]